MFNIPGFPLSVSARIPVPSGNVGLMVAISALGRLRQENYCDFKVNLDYIVSSKAV